MLSGDYITDRNDCVSLQCGSWEVVFTQIPALTCSFLFLPPYAWELVPSRALVLRHKISCVLSMRLSESASFSTVMALVMCWKANACCIVSLWERKINRHTFWYLNWYWLHSSSHRLINKCTNSSCCLLTPVNYKVVWGPCGYFIEGFPFLVGFVRVWCPSCSLYLDESFPAQQ